MKKVILIAFYFNQVNEIASKRLRALAKYLPEFGWEPIVIVPDLGFVPSENDDLNCRIITTNYEDMFSKYLNKIKPSKNVQSNVSDKSKSQNNESTNYYISEVNLDNCNDPLKFWNDVMTSVDNRLSITNNQRHK